uniref:hypothetical protein n=1 Tax=Parabacteroides distasonis TaxID=823 RepID=UPI003FED483E
MLTREEEIKPSITVVPREQRLPLPQSSIHPSIHPSRLISRPEIPGRSRKRPGPDASRPYG